MYLPIVEEGNKRVWHPERSFAFFLPFFWKHKRAVSRLNNYVSKLICERWEKRRSETTATGDTNRKEDVLDRIISAYEKEDAPKWGNAVVNQLRDELKTFMLAGHETSAAMMTWALYELVRNDELMETVSIAFRLIFFL